MMRSSFNAVSKSKIQSSSHWPALGYGFALGALAVFFFDPSRGNWRRKLVKDKFTSFRNSWNRKSSRWNRDFNNRLHGLVSEVKSPTSTSVDDVTLESRVRSEFGRIVRHSKAVKTAVKNGVIVLTGAILADEVDRLIKKIKLVPGVQDVVNQLDVYQTSIGVSELQGSGPDYLQ